MKKIIIVLTLLAVMLSGCQLMYEIADMSFEERYNNQKLTDFHLENENFKTIEDIGRFLKDNITYKKGAGDHVQSPKDTWKLKTGNYGAFTVLLMDIALFELGIECSIVFVNPENMTKTVENGGFSSYHIMVRHEGIIYSPQNGSIYNGEVDYSLTFYEIFN